MTRLPDPVQRVLAGPPLTIDGQRLAVETQLMLRLKRVARLPDVARLPVPEGRMVTQRETRIAGGRFPIGHVRDLDVGGCRGRLYVPSSAGREPGGLLVYFHGGGFVLGDLDTHDAPCRFLAERAGVRVLSVDYRRAPEHPFPAAYDDAVAATRWVFEHAEEVGADPARIAVGGDSAGGNLATGAAIAAALDGLPVAFQLLIYPVTDATHPTRSHELFADRELYLTRAYLEMANECYLPSVDDRTDGRASPLYEKIPHDLAPAYVVTAGFDPLRDEGEAYARLLREQGVSVEMRRFPDLIHGFVNMLGVGRRNQAATAEIAVRLRAALAPQS